MVPAQDKAEGGTNKQPDKAPVTKGGLEPNPGDPQNYKGEGVQSFRPTHPAEDPPTQTPPPIAT